LYGVWSLMPVAGTPAGRHGVPLHLVTPGAERRQNYSSSAEFSTV